MSNYRLIKNVQDNSCVFCQYYDESSLITYDQLFIDSCKKYGVEWNIPLEISERSIKNDPSKWICDDFIYKDYNLKDDNNGKTKENR